MLRKRIICLRKFQVEQCQQSLARERLKINDFVDSPQELVLVCDALYIFVVVNPKY